MTFNRLMEGGVLVLIDARHGMAHNKEMIFDEKEMVTGLFNFTNWEEHYNAENAAFIKIKAIVNEYEANFQFHLAHSQLP